MPLSIGDKLGPYEILAPIGKGGMGEVYRARDNRLDRMVAIKVLPEHLSADPQLRKRFDREARAVSGLNHPHICSLYDVGHQDGIDYLVMEYLEGETLAERLKKGPLSLRQVFQFAIEVAGALDHAHRHGVVHRDLKPANIMLTKAGAKVLDFGLAKTHVAAAAADAPAGVTQPTKELTEAGVILGTLQYMAPEQLEAKEASPRTDIFAFGSVVYEMATGKKAFEGQSRVTLIAAILEREPPPLAGLDATQPAPLDRIVKKCLSKDPDRRWQTAQDLQDELQWIAGESSQAGVAVHAPAGLGRANRAWVAVAAVSILLAGLAFAYFTRRPPDSAVVRFSFEPPFKAGGLDVAVSPDGTQIAFCGDSGLWLRRMDSFTAQELPGTEGALRPFWSPDGRQLGFVVQGDGVKRMDLRGGQNSVQRITSFASFAGGSWSQQGVILFQPEQTGSGIYRVPVGGGTPSPVTSLNAARREISHRCPQFLPDGRHFIYWVWSQLEENTGAYIGSLDPDEKRMDGPLVRTWREAHYADPGYLLFLQGSTLMERRFDPSGLTFTGEPRPLPEQIGVRWDGAGLARFSTSATGTLVYQAALPRPRANIVLRDRAGNQLRTIEAPPASDSPGLDPRGRYVVVAAADENSMTELWTIDLERGISSRLTETHGTSAYLFPTPSPDGQRIAFVSNHSGSYDLWVRTATGIGNEELLVKSPQLKTPTGWSMDGQYLVYGERDPVTKWDIWVLPLTGNRKPIPFLKTGFSESGGTLSPGPDSLGHLWMAYESDETGSSEIYLRPFAPDAPGGPAGDKIRVTAAGGSGPQWRKDGRELFYFDGLNLMAVDVKLGAKPEIGVPHMLFAARSTDSASFGDGQRFLFIERPEPPRPRINVVVNWGPPK
jgi:Tol biopolymer transport system component/predicted Ser/Thr protein kinase